MDFRPLASKEGQEATGYTARELRDFEELGLAENQQHREHDFQDRQQTKDCRCLPLWKALIHQVFAMTN